MQCPTNDTLEFLENNQAILTVYLQGRSDGMGGVTRFCVDNPTPDQLGWLLNDKTITFDFGGGDTEEAQITEFTDSRLVLKYMYEDGGQTFEDIEVYTKSTTP